MIVAVVLLVALLLVGVLTITGKDENGVGYVDRWWNKWTD